MRASNPPLPRVLEVALAALAERLLALDEESRERLSALGESIIEVRVEASEPDAPGARSGFGFVMRIDRGQVEVAPSGALTPDIVISGTLGQIVRFFTARGADREQGFGDLRVEGEQERLASFERIVRYFDPDWEAPASRLVGDVAARHLGTLARGLSGWLCFARERAQGATFEYLQYESSAVPSRIEWEDFAARVERLHRRLDALDARANSKPGATGPIAAAPDPSGLGEGDG